MIRARVRDRVRARARVRVRVRVRDSVCFQILSRTFFIAFRTFWRLSGIGIGLRGRVSTFGRLSGIGMGDKE